MQAQLVEQCLARNGDPSERSATEIELTKEQWQNIAIELWDILDDIDTSLDMFKPQMENFERYVVRKVGTRFQWLTSDGYRVFPTAEKFGKPCMD